jgi:hypothetical protein
MNIEQRKSVIHEKLESMGETITTWSKKNKLDHRLVGDGGHPLKGCCQRQRLPLRMKIEYFQPYLPVADIVTITAISFYFRCQL